MERPRLPLGLLGFLGLLLGVESFIGARPTAFLDLPAYGRRFSYTYACADAIACEFLLLGDSMVKLGLLPEVIRTRTGWKAFNLAVPGAPAAVTFETLKRAIDAGARPRAIVVDFGPGPLGVVPGVDPEWRADLYTTTGAVELVRATGDGRIVHRLLLNGFLPSLRCRAQVRSGVLSALRGEPNAQERLNRACRRNWLLNEGAHVAAKDPTYDGSPDRGAGGMLAGRARFHPANVVAVERFFRLAEAENIRVYWLLPPVAPRLYEARCQRGVEEYLTRFARAIQARHPSLTVLDARGSGYPASLFIDATHLDIEGALALSTAVAERLDADVEGGGWFELPSPSPPATVPAIEDFERSREVVALLEGERQR